MHRLHHPDSTSERTLRQFAALWLIFFGAAAAGEWLTRGRPHVAAGLAVWAVTGGAMGLVAPRLLRPVFEGWTAAARPVGWVVSHALLAVLFYGVFTPVGLALRLLGRDPLGCRGRRGRETYWEPKPMAEDVRRYFRQF